MELGVFQTGIITTVILMVFYFIIMILDFKR